MTGYFLNNRISSFMVLSAFLTAGIVSLARLPVSLMPGSDYPAVSILIEYPGIGPDKIESLITKPVERIIRSVNGITEISSVSEEGKSRINVTFTEKTDIKMAQLKLKERIELIRDSFPREVQEPVVFRYDPSERPVVIASVEMDGLNIEETRDFAEKKIKPMLQRVDGISEVNIAGGTVKEIHVEVDRSMLEARGLSLGDISSCLVKANVSLPGGIVETGRGLTVLSIPSRFISINEIADIVINMDKNRPVYLRDVAHVSYAGREKEDYSRYNGRDLVTIYIHRGSGANTLSVCNESVQALNSFAGAGYNIIYNQGRHIQTAVRNAALSGMWSMVIVFIVLSVFFRRKESVIPVALSVPCSMFIIPFFLYAGGRGINIMTLSGLALSAGMVVDNGIVIIEAINSHGDWSVKGILEAVNSVKPAVISSTLTTVSVFAPVAILSSRAESMYGDMAFTVNRALAVALFTAIILVPSFFISFRNLRIPGLAAFLHRRIQPYLAPAAYVEKCEERCRDIYRNMLGFVFENSGRIIFIFSGILLLSAVIFTVMDMSPSPDGEGQDFHMYMEFPTGTSLDVTDTGAREVERIAAGMKGVQDVSAKVEKWRGTLTIRTDPALDMKKRKELKQSLKDSADACLKEFKAFSYISGTDDSASEEITVHFTGDDPGTLKKTAREAASRIRGISGIDECYLRFRDGRPEFLLLPDREKCAMSGVPVSGLAERMRSALFGPVSSKFIDEDREVDIRVGFAEGYRDTIDNLMKGVVKNHEGTFVPVPEMLTLREAESPTRIYRLNGRKSFSVTARPVGISIIEAERRIRRVLDSMTFPGEYTYRFEAKLDEIRKERNELILSVILSILLIYMILASLFESLLLPVLIMITIPLALCGTAPVLFLAGVAITPQVYLGLIMLIGIVVNNGILLVEPLNREFHAGILNAGNLAGIIRSHALKRFRPVMLTVMTTVFGMVPLLAGGGEGSSLWFSFALTVTSGLVFSTAMTLAVVPLMSYYFYRRIL